MGHCLRLIRPRLQALWYSVVLMMAAAGASVVAEDGITVGSVAVVTVLGGGVVLVAVTVQRFRATFRCFEFVPLPTLIPTLAAVIESSPPLGTHALYRPLLERYHFKHHLLSVSDLEGGIDGDKRVSPAL